MSTNGLTDHDLTQLLTPTRDSGGVMELHYFRRHQPTAPALCGTMPDGGSWEHHYRPGTTAYTAGGKLAPQFELCPACQVRYSYLPASKPMGGGAQ